MMRFILALSLSSIVMVPCGYARSVSLDGDVSRIVDPHRQVRGFQPRKVQILSLPIALAHAHAPHDAIGARAPGARGPAIELQHSMVPRPIPAPPAPALTSDLPFFIRSLHRTAAPPGNWRRFPKSAIIASLARTPAA